MSSKFHVVVNNFQLRLSMLNEVVLYAFIAGVLFFAVAWGIFKDGFVSALISVVIGLLFILFIFTEPKSAKSFGDMADNLTLLIMKGIWGVSWIAGVSLAFWVANKLKKY